MPSKYEIENALLKELYNSDDTVAPINEESSSPLNDLFKSLAWKKRRISPSDNILLQRSVGKPVYEDFEIPPNWTDEKLNETIAQLRAQQKIDNRAAGRNVAGGLTWDASDEIEAGIRGALDPTKTYGDYRQQIDREREEYRQRKPGEALAQEIIPSLVSGFGLVKALPKVGKAVMGSKILNSPWFRAPVGGALSAGLYGAGAKPYDSQYSRLGEGLMTAPYGLAGGLLGPVAGQASKVAPPIRKLLNKNRQEEFLRERAKEKEFPVDEINKALEDVDESIVQPSLAGVSEDVQTIARLTGDDLGAKFSGRSGREVSEQLAEAQTLPLTRHSPPMIINKQHKEDFLFNEEGIQGKYDKLLNDPKQVITKTDATGKIDEVSAKIFAVLTGKSRLGQKMRNSLRAKQEKLRNDDRVLLNTKERTAHQQELDDINNTLNKIDEGNLTDLTIREINLIKTTTGNSIEDQKRKFYREGRFQEFDEARTDADSMRKWLQEVDKQLPDYAKVRKFMQNEFDYKDAYNNGQSFFKKYRTTKLQRGEDANSSEGVFASFEEQKKYIESLTNDEKLRFQAAALIELDKLVKSALDAQAGSAKAVYKAIAKEIGDGEQGDQVFKKLSLIMGEDDAKLFTAALDLDARMINNYKKLDKLEEVISEKQIKEGLKEEEGFPEMGMQSLGTKIIDMTTALLRSKRLSKKAKQNLYDALTSNKPTERAAAVLALEKANDQKNLTRPETALGQLSDLSSLGLGRTFATDDLDLFNMLFLGKSSGDGDQASDSTQQESGTTFLTVEQREKLLKIYEALTEFNLLFHND
jgi:hypothetical protein